jgi:hypothetical protein
VAINNQKIRAYPITGLLFLYATVCKTNANDCVIFLNLRKVYKHYVFTFKKSILISLSLSLHFSKRYIPKSGRRIFEEIKNHFGISNKRLLRSTSNVKEVMKIDSADIRDILKMGWQFPQIFTAIAHDGPPLPNYAKLPISCGVGPCC